MRRISFRLPLLFHYIAANLHRSLVASEHNRQVYANTNTDCVNKTDTNVANDANRANTDGIRNTNGQRDRWRCVAESPGVVPAHVLLLYVALCVFSSRWRSYPHIATYLTYRAISFFFFLFFFAFMYRLMSTDKRCFHVHGSRIFQNYYYFRERAFSFFILCYLLVQRISFLCFLSRYNSVYTNSIYLGEILASNQLTESNEFLSTEFIYPNYYKRRIIFKHRCNLYILSYDQMSFNI